MRRLFTKKAALASWTYLGVTTGFGILSLIAATAWLQPEQAGFWFTLQATGSFVALCEWGTTYVIMREMATNSVTPAKTAKASSHQEAIYKTTNNDQIKIRKIVSINLATAVIVSFGFLAYFTLIATGDSKSLMLSWAIYAIGVGFNIAAGPLKALLESQSSLHAERFTSAASHALTSSMIIGTAYTYENILPMAVVSAAGASATYFALHFVARRRFVDTVLHKHLLTSGIKAIYRESLGFSWINIGATTTKSAYAPIVTGIIGAAALAPIYLANKVFATASTAINILVVSERSTITKLLAIQDFEAINNHINKSLRINVILSTIAAIFLGIALHYSPKIFDAPQYSLPTAVLVILTIDLVLNNVTSACAHIVNALGENPFKASVPISGAITIVSLFILIPSLGVLGAVLAPFLGGLLTSYWYNPLRLVISKKRLISKI